MFSQRISKLMIKTMTTKLKNTNKKLSKNKLKKIQKEENAKNACLNIFSTFYTQFYDKERWESSLLPALCKPVRHCALVNRYAEKDIVLRILDVGDSSDGIDNNTEVISTSSQFYEKVPYTVVKSCEDSSDDGIQIRSSNIKKSHAWPQPSSSADTHGLYPYYPMDAASVIPVLCMNLNNTVELDDVKQDKESMQIFDMCSAPGGKALAICMTKDLLKTNSHLYCADISSERRARLKRVISNYIPSTVRSDNISVITGDGTSPSFYYEFGPNKFDRILVDAPCSSERHVLQDDGELLKWGSGRSRINAKRQLALMLNAVKLIKPNGRIVYSTCSLSPYENDHVIEKLLKKTRKQPVRGGTDGFVKSLKVVDLHVQDIRIGGDKTEYGWHLLPDISDGWGPIYVCALDVIECEASDLLHDNVKEYSQEEEEEEDDSDINEDT